MRRIIAIGRLMLLAFSICLGTGIHAQPVPPPPLLIENVRLVDFAGDAPRIRPGMSVFVKNGKIARIGKAGTLAGEGASRIDGAGRTLMPGLVDMHVHVWDEAALGAYLAYGITSVRNMSGMPFHLETAKRIEAGALPGPRLFTTGPILNSHGDNEQINHQFVTTAQEARAAVRGQYEAGYRHLKVYSNLTREAYEAIRDEAKQLGMTLTGHTPEGRRERGMPREKPFALPVDELLDDGFTTFEHVETLMWHGLRDRRDEAAARVLARRIAASGTPVDPTLLAYYNLLRVAESKGAFLDRPDTALINPLLKATSGEDYARWSGEDVEAARKTFAFLQRFTAIMAEEGVTLVTGDDAGIFTNSPGVSLADELRLMQEAGLSPHQLLKAATYNGARILDGEGSGEIAPGVRADLLLISGDPLADPLAATRPDMVFVSGRPHDSARLATLLEAARHADMARTARNVLEGLRAQDAPDEVVQALQGAFGAGD